MLERNVVPVDHELAEFLGGGATWSESVTVGDLIWVSAQIGFSKATGTLVEGFEGQVEQAFQNLKQALERAGSTLEDVIVTNVYLTDPDDYWKFAAIARRVFPKDPPARPDVVVRDHVGHALMAVEAVAVKNTASASRWVVPLDSQLAEALGAEDKGWSDAVGAGDLVWVTGQIGWDKTTGSLLEGLEDQTKRALENLRDVVERAGSSLDDLVMTHVYLTNPDDYRRVEEIFQTYFPKDPPARVVVVVQSLIDHNVCRIDIAAVAARA